MIDCLGLFLNILFITKMIIIKNISCRIVPNMLKSYSNLIQIIFYIYG